MSNTTKVLREQSGIQYQGVQDKSEADPRDTLSNAVFTGIFKRGRLDKPMKVTSGNIRAKLGYDPTNLAYMAVEDCLKTGVPFVYVLRTESECNCQSSIIKMQDNYRVRIDVANLRYRLLVNDKEFVDVQLEMDYYSAIDGLLLLTRSEQTALQLSQLLHFTMMDDEFNFTLENATNECMKVKLNVEILDINTPGNEIDKPAKQIVQIFDLALCASENTVNEPT